MEVVFFLDLSCLMLTCECHSCCDRQPHAWFLISHQTMDPIFSSCADEYLSVYHHNFVFVSISWAQGLILVRLEIKMKQKTEISRVNLSEQSREQANSTHVKFQGRNQTHATLGWPECSPLSVPTLFQCGCDTAPSLIVVGIMYVKVYFVGLPRGLGFISCQDLSYFK